MKRIVSLLLVLLMSVSLLSGCGGTGTTETSKAPDTTTSSAPEVKGPNENSTLNADITFWSSYTESSNYGQCIAAAADAFMKENPGVKITISFQGTDISSTLGPALQAGNNITMFEANSDNVIRLWNDYLMDLGDFYAATYPQTDGKPYSESIVPAYEILAKDQGNGKYVYFPYTPQFLNVWYNKDIFDACGITEKPKSLFKNF